MRKKDEKISPKGKIIIYGGKSRQPQLEVHLENDTVWLTQAQIAVLFDTDRTSITKHIKNIIKTEELSEKSNVQFLHIAQSDKSVKFYNLNFILSIGYRVNSKHATQFRVWATKILRTYIVDGFVLNQKRLYETELREFEQALALIKQTMGTKQLGDNEAKGLLQVITDYANSWLLLQKYDDGRLEIEKTAKRKYLLVYNEAVEAIATLKQNLQSKKEASDLFGNEHDNMLSAILGNINQTFDGNELYSSIESKAAHLLYFIIKDHPFTDGNKRIGSFLFILFLSRNLYLFKSTGERKINDNALVALALLVAESDPKQKETMILLIMNLLRA